MTSGFSQTLGNLSIIQQNLSSISNQLSLTNTSIQAAINNVAVQIALMNDTMISNFNLVASNFTYTNNLILSVNASIFG
jgi:hypothetical protein